jgi:phospholipid/cholesterol/gamma-HCH transport system ATP-binding protein
MENIIELKDISVISQEYTTLLNITCGVPAGRTTLILGPSGCGKSTLLKVMAGIIIPDSGKVLLEGQDYHLLSEKRILEFKKRNGFVFQDSALWANKNVFENLSLPLRFHYPELDAAQIEEKVKRALDYINLNDSIYLRPAQLSLGEQKMISFTRALITQPTVVFMDEPTLSVDMEMKAKLLAIIKKLKNAHCTIVAVIHESAIVSMLADNLIILKSGMILAQGPFNQVINSNNSELKGILNDILQKPSSYDQDILDLLNE